ncbi:aldo/keto reductase [Kitasatospora sp. NPDC048296]|uniref:aldo/keto reductase n=1 Tax=Kitasatospora sp. NPDC048296 TaxID=3364048 RepID=UPI0037230BEC
MRYRLFGRRSGLRVSEIALGTGKFGTTVPAQQAAAVLAGYADAGGRFLDTAPGYQGGQAELLVGRFLGRERQQWVIATKYGIGTERTEGFVERGNGRRVMIRSVEQSLKRLGTDYIDLLFTHGYDAHVPVEETLAAFDSLVTSGKVLHVGLGNYPAWKIARAATITELRGLTALAGITTEYGPAERDAEREILPAAEALGLGVTAWSVLGGGFLAREPDPPGTPPASHLPHWTEAGRPGPREAGVHEAVAAVAAETGLPRATVGYAWLLERARTSSTALIPVLGASSPTQLAGSLNALSVTLSPEHLARIDDAGTPALGEPHVHNFHSDPLVEGGPYHRPAVPVA